ncbi:MAG: YveK family protein [Tepidibacillus sp.]
METRDQEEMELDLRELFAIIKKRIRLIVLITLITTLASGVISFFVLTPIYESSTELLVNKTESDINAIVNYNDIQTNLKLIETYNVIIKSPRIIDLVVKNYHLDLTTEELTKKIQVNAVKDSQVMSITVTDPDQAKAAMLANAVADTFKEEIVKIMKVDNVQILTEAKALDHPSPVKPKPLLNVAIAFVLGLMVSIGIVFLLEYLDTTVKSEQEIEKLLGYPVLGSIGTIDKAQEGKRKRNKKKSAAMNMVRGETYES